MSLVDFILAADLGLLAIIALLLLLWLIVGYALFREYRRAGPDWPDR